jgi:hypothetical protein
MTKKEKAALVLERKILNAIEAGEFTPDYGYLNNLLVGNGSRAGFLGPCGCALAAAASVNGFESITAGPIELRQYLKTVEMSEEDSIALEDGYEDNFESSTNPYFRVGQRLRRFHP